MAVNRTFTSCALKPTLESKHVIACCQRVLHSGSVIEEPSGREHAHLLHHDQELKVALEGYIGRYKYGNTALCKSWSVEVTNIPLGFGGVPF